MAYHHRTSAINAAYELYLAEADDIQRVLVDAWASTNDPTARANANEDAAADYSIAAEAYAAVVDAGTLVAQDLYDWRERTAAISGSDLHDLFRALCNGEPSPRGATVIDGERLRVVAACNDGIAEDARRFLEATA